MTNPHYFRSSVANILDVLGHAEVFLLWNSVGLDEIEGISRISWLPPAPGELFRLAGDRLDSYPAWVSANAFSGLLFDGSLIQLTWSIAAGDIIGHRLAYIPCPLVLDRELLRTEPILDVWELARSSPYPEFMLRGAVRFDYDPVAAKPGHPASHFTFGNPETRIPVVYPLGPSEFFRFVFKNFYPDVWSKMEYLRTLKPSFDWSKTLLDEEHEEVHLRWEQSPVALR